jgi:hypothetical protein
MSFMRASPAVLGEQQERERERERGNHCTNTGRWWLAALFFSVSSSYMRTCHNFFKTSNGDAGILKGETEMKREKEKEYRDLFHPSAAFGTSLHINK